MEETGAKAGKVGEECRNEQRRTAGGVVSGGVDLRYRKDMANCSPRLIVLGLCSSSLLMGVVGVAGAERGVGFVDGVSVADGADAGGVEDDEEPLFPSRKDCNLGGGGRFGDTNDMLESDEPWTTVVSIVISPIS